MKKSVVFLAGVLTGALLVPLGVFVYLALGAFNVAATAKPSGLEEALAELAVDRSVKRRAPKADRAPAPSRVVLAEGLSHYRENCLPCHGAPGVKRSEIGMGINPAAPDLHGEDGQDLTDGELFWITSQGIRMTAMPAFSPTHSAEEIWKIVAFVRHLPKLEEAEKAALAERVEEEGAHHE